THLHVVDGERDQVLLRDLRGVAGLRRLSGHAFAPAVACAVAPDAADDSEPNSVLAAGSNGQPPCSKCARYSWRKCLIDDWIGAAPPSASAQNDRPAMLSVRSSRVSRSSAVPSPASSRASFCTSHQKPSRHGVHLPHDSCL